MIIYVKNYKAFVNNLGLAALLCGIDKIPNWKKKEIDGGMLVDLRDEFMEQIRSVNPEVAKGIINFK